MSVSENKNECVSEQRGERKGKGEGKRIVKDERREGERELANKRTKDLTIREKQTDGKMRDAQAKQGKQKHRGIKQKIR